MQVWKELDEYLNSLICKTVLPTLQDPSLAATGDLGLIDRYEFHRQRVIFSSPIQKVSTGLYPNTPDFAGFVGRVESLSVELGRYMDLDPCINQITTYRRFHTSCALLLVHMLFLPFHTDLDTLVLLLHSCPQTSMLVRYCPFLLRFDSEYPY